MTPIERLRLAIESAPAVNKEGFCTRTEIILAADGPKLLHLYDEAKRAQMAGCFSSSSHLNRAILDLEEDDETD